MTHHAGVRRYTGFLTLQLAPATKLTRMSLDT
jgi:hypothetical protein